ncbi:MAG: Bax inhibitor-1/YccA family protein [Puniceicoccales bacterium]|jgi:uncharacterized YccA/Bax inhibitor family protein|nr:Bax inhibitor-1/YccA family protein [Puniceicoccales bacterium]
MNYDNTSNPILRDSVFDIRDAQTIPMTINGVVRKSFIALSLLLGGAAFAWTRSYTSVQDIAGKIVLFSIVVLALNLVTVFNHNVARITVPLYALAEGLVVGSFSLIMQKFYPGIVVQAVTGTIGVFASMLFIYKTGIYRPSDRFMTILFMASLGFSFIYLANFILSCLGFSGLHIISSSSPLGIAFSAIVCIIAALNLLIDFEFIVRQSKMGAPEKLEWIATLGLLVTVIWIYFEILNLLAKLYSKRD